MKLTGIRTERSRPGTAPESLSAATKGGAKPSAARAGGGDKVRLSSVAAELASLVAAGSGGLERAPADPARIEALRDAVQKNRYPVDVRALADAILSEDLPTLFG